MNLGSFIGYCCGMSYVKKDKLDQAVADERIIQTQNSDEVEINQRQAQRGQASTPLPNRFVTNPNLSPFNRQPPTNPQNTDIVARMFNRAAEQAQNQQSGLMAQLRASIANPATVPRLMNAMLAQVASVFMGNKQLMDADESVKDIREKADEEAAREDPGLMMVDVVNTSGVNTGPQ